MSVNISDVLNIVNSQNQWRGKETINLIASENVQSDAVKQIESLDIFFSCVFLVFYCESIFSCAR